MSLTAPDVFPSLHCGDLWQTDAESFAFFPTRPALVSAVFTPLSTRLDTYPNPPREASWARCFDFDASGRKFGLKPWRVWQRPDGGSRFKGFRPADLRARISPLTAPRPQRGWGRSTFVFLERARASALDQEGLLAQ